MKNKSTEIKSIGELEAGDLNPIRDLSFRDSAEELAAKLFLDGETMETVQIVIQGKKGIGDLTEQAAASVAEHVYSRLERQKLLP